MKVTPEDLLYTINGEWFGRMDALEGPAQICLDTRTIGQGQIFLGIAGERYDGSLFAEEALQKGAAGVIVNRRPPEGYPPAGRFWVTVNDGLEGLWQIAGCLRQRFPGWVVAVTGTVGKTGTKEWIAAALSGTKKVYRSRLSENNEIGVPKTFLEAPQDTEALVLEFGMRKPGDIEKLTALARPHIGVITGITPVHLETMGDIEKIARGKGELLAGLEPPAVSIINADTECVEVLKGLAAGIVITFGKRGDFSFETGDMDERGRCTFQLSTPSWKGAFRSPLAGEIQGYGVTAALAVAETVGVPIESALAGMDRMAPLPHRLQVIPLNAGGVLIDDCYNASPEAMHSAIDFAAKMGRNRRKVAILGAMLELGSESERFHKAVAGWLKDAGFDLFVGVGKEMEPAVVEAESEGIRSRLCESAHEVTKCFDEIGDGAAVVLVKGSRAVHLEKVVEEYLWWIGHN
jgi:UDP-N-acetylmuramoyl-tripeptide--D-alanyl-D-alanine ligase